MKNINSNKLYISKVSDIRISKSCENKNLCLSVSGYKVKINGLVIYLSVKKLQNMKIGEVRFILYLLTVITSKNKINIG